MKQYSSVVVLAALTLFVSIETITDAQPLSDADADAIVKEQVEARAEKEAKRPINQVDLHVLEQREVQRETGQRLILNRVSPPDLPEIDSASISEPDSDVSEDAFAVRDEFNLSDWELQMLKRTDFRTNIVLSLSATIYDREITRIQWHRGDSEYTVYSNIDFNYLRGVHGFPAPDGEHYYTLNMGIGEASISDLNEVFDSIPSFGSGRAEYIPSSESPGFNQNNLVMAPIDALHEWYDENKARLDIEYQRREALNAAWKRYNEANLPEQEETIINFWPTRSKRYQTQ